jgi:DNA repair protein RadC
LAQRGPGGLSAAELIALVWGTGARGMNAVDLAEEALVRHDGLTCLARASDTELAAIPGIGPARAAQLSVAFELGRRLLADWPTGRWTIRAPRDVAERLILQMGRLEREELRVVLLNTKDVVLRVATVYQGNVSSSLVRVGELYRDAVRLNASGVILVHNHPSGDPTPSLDDLHLTAEALAAGRLTRHRAARPPRDRPPRLRLAARARRRVRSSPGPP